MQKALNQNDQTSVKPIDKLTYFMETICASRGGYLSDQLYHFEPTEQTSFKLALATKKKKLFWLMISREHYFETTKEYPIANKQELKNALKFDDNIAPFQGVMLYHIVRINEQSHRVTFWIFKPNLLAQIPFTPVLVLPESYVLAKGIELNKTGVASIDTSTQTLFIAQTEQGILSAIKTKQLPTLESFSFSVGAPLIENSKHCFISEKIVFEALLYKSIKELPLSALKTFWLPAKKRDWKSYPWKLITGITASLFVLYIAITSSWLVYSQYQVEQQIKSKMPVVNKALLLQKEYQRKQQWQQKLIKPMQNQNPYWNVWPIFLNIKEIGATVTALHYKNKEITLHGSTNKTIKATDILAMLNVNPMANSPRFSRAVRKSKGREQFVISFKLQLAPLVVTKKTNDLSEVSKELVIKGGDNKSAI